MIISAISVGLGGLGVALAKMAIASQKGLKINLTNISGVTNNHILFSETQSRIIATIKPSKRQKFEKYFNKEHLLLIGKVIKNKKIFFKMNNKEDFEVDVNSLSNQYKRGLFI